MGKYEEHRNSLLDMSNDLKRIQRGKLSLKDSIETLEAIAIYIKVRMLGEDDQKSWPKVSIGKVSLTTLSKQLRDIATCKVDDFEAHEILRQIVGALYGNTHN